MPDDSDITLFAKILDHKVDEQFWYVQQHVKQTVLTLYKGYIREKFQRILTQEMNTLIYETTNDQLEVDVSIARKVLQHMYDDQDSRAFDIMLHENTSLKYSTFIKMILDFQLAEHEKYLKGFNSLFQRIDLDNDGLIDLTQFVQLMEGLQIGLSMEQIK